MAEFPAAQFELFQAADVADAKMAEGISLCLYRVAVTSTRRNLPPRVDEEGRKFRPSLPLDLFYLLSAWGESPEMQQNLLGWAMRQLEDTPILPAALLNHFGPDPHVFGPGETVELICETPTLQDMVGLWEVFKSRSNRQLSVTYTARMVSIESRVAMSEYGPAQTRVFQFGNPAGE